MPESHEGRAEPLPARRKNRKRTLTDIVISVADNFHWFKPMRVLAARALPARHRKKAALMLVPVALTLTAFTVTEPTRIVAEMYGPDVVIGVADADALRELGKRSLLYEFVFEDRKLARSVGRDGDLHKLFRDAPFAALRPQCETELGGELMRIYKLVVVAQNSGHKTAKGYEMILSFSSESVDAPDPGIRVLGIGTDALRVAYLYQQESREAIGKALAACHTLTPLVEELLKEEPPKAGPDEPGGPAKIPALTRDTYQTLGLTRDLVILSGSLEARLFQAATVLVAVPVGRRKFATVFHVECSNCSWFYKTNSFAQVVGTADIAPEVDISDLPYVVSNG